MQHCHRGTTPSRHMDISPSSVSPRISTSARASTPSTSAPSLCWRGYSNRFLVCDQGGWAFSLPPPQDAPSHRQRGGIRQHARCMPQRHLGTSTSAPCSIAISAHCHLGTTPSRHIDTSSASTPPSFSPGIYIGTGIYVIIYAFTFSLAESGYSTACTMRHHHLGTISCSRTSSRSAIKGGGHSACLDSHLGTMTSTSSSTPSPATRDTYVSPPSRGCPCQQVKAF